MSANSLMVPQLLGSKAAANLPNTPILRLRRGRRSCRSRPSFYAIKATEHEIAFPRFQKLGFLTQARLIERAQAGDVQARQEVWLRNARLTYSIANRFRCRHDHMADLIQAGVLGISKAIDKFNVSLLFDFSSYAWQVALREMQRCGRETVFSIRIPPHRYVDYAHFRKTFSRTRTRSDWFDARETLLDRFGQSDYRMLLRLHCLATPQPLESARTIAAPASDILNRRMEHECCLALLEEVNKLSPRKRYIIIHRYGLFNTKPKTLKEISKQLKLTRERVRQIQGKIEHALRIAMYHRGFLDRKPASPAAGQPATIEP